METELIKHQWNSNLKPQPSLGFFGILKESFKTANRNRKLLFPVLLLVFLSFSQLNFAEVYLLEPVAPKKISFQLTYNPKLLQHTNGNTTNPAINSDAINDIRKFFFVKLSILTLNWIINLVFVIAIVSSSSKAYTAKLLDPKEMISNVRKSYKNLSDTSFCLVLITLGLVTLCFFSMGTVFILAAGSSVAYLFNVVLSLSIAALGFYVSALWVMSMVVSVLEDVGGLDAIVRAKQQLIKGKRVQASLMMVLVAVVYGLVGLTKDALPICNLDKWSRLAVTIPFGNGMICILKLFIFVVFTVFYHEQQESFEEKEGKEGKGLYVPLAADEV